MLLDRPWPKTTEAERIASVKETWDELGYKIRATGFNLWVRTLPFPKKSRGGIWFSPKMMQFHGGVSGHLITIRAVVLSAGPVGVAKAFKPGDLVEFQRLFFAYHQKMNIEEQDYVGWIDANQCYWKIEDDEELGVANDLGDYGAVAAAAG